ncbi:hypothetical protein GUITHDRAFT_156248 [Guillardia theta CCMP2712]|uniref:Uncharacterized protein n=1 Tax=Guillardia theta (strain CCMP2712) TaxID=905079 RepID=L1IA91_GUITC|nr:hypothetical protein GUITHDRAFT_156248 [Guillardia theta CCMP2712]EKX32760.1 hypothetical protein GUITHDRAFT_156248 [Guillardia theta CCMP2712]|eukprot:XP_005819740.1 hypothetical protein GUITHDRAFT_156248 [Guillardia theta CCMP2712]
MAALVMTRSSIFASGDAEGKNSRGWTELEQEVRRGRVRGSARHHVALRADSSLSDFFKAAMNGDFQRKRNVDLATDGLLGPRQLAARRHAREQSLAERSTAMPVHVHAPHHVMMSQKHMAHSRDHIDAAGATRREQLRQIQKRISIKYPSEDKFVATYRGSLPRGDVPVDAVSFGPYVPL